MSEKQSAGRDAFNMSMRKFLKEVGVTSQQEIEAAMRKAVEDGALSGKTEIAAQVTLTIGELSLTHVVDGRIIVPGDE